MKQAWPPASHKVMSFDDKSLIAACGQMWEAASDISPEIFR